jgi:hypothetical protein
MNNISLTDIIEKLGGKKAYLKECKATAKHKERIKSYTNLPVRNFKDGFGIDHSDVIGLY